MEIVLIGGVLCLLFCDLVFVECGWVDDEVLFIVVVEVFFEYLCVFSCFISLFLVMRVMSVRIMVMCCLCDFMCVCGFEDRDLVVCMCV